MNNQYRGLKIGFVRVTIYASIVFVIAEFIKLDAALVQGQESKFSESSYTEYAQSLLLLICSSIYLFVFSKVRFIKTLSLVLFAFSFSSLIREQDSFLDLYVFDGAWQGAVFVLLVNVGFYTYRNWSSLLENINIYVGSSAFGIFISGVLTTYLFSRLYGRTTFWTTVMENRYFRNVKNASEECVELYGYGILLVAAMEFLFSLRSYSLAQQAK